MRLLFPGGRSIVGLHLKRHLKLEATCHVRNHDVAISPSTRISTVAELNVH